MLDVRDLETRWNKYNKKRKRPLYIGISTVAILIFATGVLQYKNINLKSHFSLKKYIKIPEQKNENLAGVKTKVDTQNANDINTKFLINDKFNQLEIKKEIVVEKKAKPKTVEPSVLPIDEDELFTENDITKPVIRKKPINIIKVASSNAYKDVERRFRRSHNINDSIFLANMYYKKKNYQKAIYWAKQTNKLDNNIEESWLIFAKCKVKLGHKNEAIRVLKAYIRRSNSYEAKKLLKKLIN